MLKAARLCSPIWMKTWEKNHAAFVKQNGSWLDPMVYTLSPGELEYLVSYWNIGDNRVRRFMQSQPLQRVLDQFVGRWRLDVIRGPNGLAFVRELLKDR